MGLALAQLVAQQQAPDAGIGTVGGVLGTAGGVVTALGGLYLLYKRYKDDAQERQTKRKEGEQARQAKALALRETEISVEALATKKVAEAWDALASERKAAHERDVAFLRSEIEANKKRLAELEQNNRDCHDTTAALRSQNIEQASEMAALRVKIDGLERQLKATGAIPGTDHHRPLLPG